MRNKRQFGGDFMAEFCPECFNKVFGTNYSENDFILSDELDLCEECEEIKLVVWDIKEFKYIRNPFSFYEDFAKSIINSIKKALHQLMQSFLFFLVVKLEI